MWIMATDMESGLAEREQREMRERVLRHNSFMGMTADIEEFRAVLINNKQKLDILTDFILSNLVEGVDYGRVPLNRNKTLMSKPILLQPGAEKIMAYLCWRVEYETDYDSTSAFINAGQGSGEMVLTFRASLYGNNDLRVGVGVGAASTFEYLDSAGKLRPTAANQAMKIGKKRALVDAVKSSAALSMLFTQDAEVIEAMSDAPTHTVALEHGEQTAASRSLKESRDRFQAVRGQVDSRTVLDVIGRLGYPPFIDMSAEQLDRVVQEIKRVAKS